MIMFVYALGLFFVIEGLVYMLAPDYVKMLLEMLQKTSVWRQRLFGIILVLIGLALLWAGHVASQPPQM